MKTDLMFINKTLLATVIALCLLVTGVISNLAFANTANNDYVEPIKVKTENSMVVKDKSLEGSKINLSIDQSGSVKFGGAKFISLSGSNVSVTISGLPLTLVTNSNTQIIGVTSIGNINPDDILSGKGIIDQSTGTITLSLLRDESQSSVMITDLEKQIQSLLDQLRKLQAQFNSIR